MSISDPENTPPDERSPLILRPRIQELKLKSKKIGPKLLTILIAIMLAISIYASFIDDSMGLVEDFLTCSTCLGLLLPLQALAHVGDDAFVNFFVEFCVNLGIEDRDVCEGAIGTQAPILAHDLRSISLASYTAKNFCSTVFGMCPLQEPIEYAVAFPVVEKVVRKRWESKGRKPLEVIHLSDVHIDRKYRAGTDAICTKVICCRYDSPPGQEIQEPAGKFGNKHCDTPPALVQSMLESMKKHTPDVSFTIFTGDIIEAAVWETTPESVARDISAWFDEAGALGTVYPALGNHDISPVNSFPRSNTRSAGATLSGSPAVYTGDSQWLFNLTGNLWKHWIGKEASDMVKTQSGCYSRVLTPADIKNHPGDGPSLRIISINTMYWYKQNFWLYDSDIPRWDPNGVLKWLTRQLSEAEKNGERAWIVGHMPPGPNDALRSQSNYLSQIFDRYNDTIAAQFYGHSHVDEFEIGYRDYNNRVEEQVTGIGFISGAVTPSSGNPVYRVYQVDPDTYEIMDFTPFYVNRTAPSYATDPEWLPYYSARHSYGKLLKRHLNITDPWPANESLNGRFWHRVTKVFQVDGWAFRLYARRRSRQGKIDLCRNESCRKRTICGLRSMRSQDNCEIIRVGFDFKDDRRDPEVILDPGEDIELDSTDILALMVDPYGFMGDYSYPQHSPCGGPGMSTMLGKLGSSFLAQRDHNNVGSESSTNTFQHFTRELKDTLAQHNIHNIHVPTIQSPRRRK